jgi:hypothetical protein
MGFPTWTLWGMGLSALGALIAIGLAFLALSPRFATRLGLFRWDRRLRTFIGYGFAFILLTFGFFVAGVPLGETPAAVEPTIATANTAGSPVPADQADVIASTETAVTATAIPAADQNASTTRTSGAFAGPPATATPVTVTLATQTVQLEVNNTPQPATTPTATPSAIETATQSPTATSTPTVTPSPTMSPTPTVTPTPIEADTAQINTQGSTLWVRRTPSGRPLALARDGDTVILLPGHANQAGLLWQEVSTVGGVSGWVQLEYLAMGQE